MHIVEFEFVEPSFGSLEIDLNENEPAEIKEWKAEQEIKAIYPDIEDIVITKIERIS